MTDQTKSEAELIAKVRSMVREYALLDLEFYTRTWGATPPDHNLRGAVPLTQARNILRDLLADLAATADNPSTKPE